MRTPVLAGVAAALLLAGGASGYALAHQDTTLTPTSMVSPTGPGSGGSDLNGSGPGGSGPGGFGPGGFGPGGPHGGTAGTIDSIDGTTITLTTPAGRNVTVTAPDTVDVTLRSEGSVADLKPGETVIVSGQTGADGSITADRIDVGGEPR